MLVTVKATPEAALQITELASIFQASIDDVGHDASPSRWRAHPRSSTR
jgi:hypothetical protein